MKVLIICNSNEELNGYLDINTFEVDVIEGIKVYRYESNNKTIYLANVSTNNIYTSVTLTLLVKYIKPNYIISSGIANAIHGVNELDIIASNMVYRYNKLENDGSITISYYSSKKLMSLASNVIKGQICEVDNYKEKFVMPSKLLAIDYNSATIGEVLSILSRSFIIFRIINNNKTKKAINKIANYVFNYLNNL